LVYEGQAAPDNQRLCDSGPSPATQLFRQLVEQLSEYQRQIAAEKALALHYGLKATQNGQAVLRALQAKLEEHLELQKAILNEGVPVQDPTQVYRAHLQIRDRLIQMESLAAQLRSQLSLLIGSQVACAYQSGPQPSHVVDNQALGNQALGNQALCDFIQAGWRHRRDLVALRTLRSRLDQENLPVARALASFSLPSGVSPLPSGRIWVSRFFSRNRDELQRELQTRRQQLAEAQRALESKIASDIEVAWLQRIQAVDRHRLATEIMQTWGERVEALQHMADLGRPQGVDLATAEIEYLKARLDQIDRLNDFHQANIRLRSAAGCLIQATQD
jgi:hypothetical protein